MMDYFQHRSTVHGLRYVAQEGMCNFRKSIWVVVFIGACAGFLVNATQRLSLFLSHPLSVNIEVKYEAKIELPAVTICNQNLFRASKAAKLGVYSLLKDFIKAGTSRHAVEQVKPSVDSLRLNKSISLYDELAHRKKDMILKCSFAGTPCSEENFVEVETDYGICYTFGGPAQRPNMVPSSGSIFGLNLILDVEHYEYMGGPHNSAGVKVLLHASDEVPFVGDMGFNVPPGRQTLVGINARRVIHMNTDGTTCFEDKPLELLSAYNYTEIACRFECQMRYLLRNCSCYPVGLPFPQPEFNDSWPKCTPFDDWICLKPARESFESVEDTTCRQCLPRCDTPTYTPIISQASISHIVATNLLSIDPRQIPVLQEKLVVALESVARADPIEVEKDSSLLQTYSDLLQKLARHNTFPDARMLAVFEDRSELDCVRHTKASVDELWKATLTSLHEIEPLIEKFTSIKTGFFITNWLHYLSDMDHRIGYFKEHDLPLLVREILKGSLTDIKLRFATEGIANHIYTARVLETKLGNTYPMIQLVLEENRFLLANAKLEAYFHGAKFFADEQVTCLAELIDRTENAFGNISDVLKNAYSLSDNEAVQSMWANANQSFDHVLEIRDRCQENFINNAFKYDSLSFARLFLSVIYEEGDQTNMTFHRIDALFKFRDTFSFGESETEQALSMITHYLQLYSSKNITKLELANNLTSYELQGQRVFIADFFTNVRKFLQTMQSTRINYLQLAENLNDSVPRMIYAYTVDQKKMGTLYDVVNTSMASCKAKIDAYTKEQVAITSSIGQNLSRLIGDYSQQLTDYIAKSKLDFNFIMQNFIDLSIFFPELREELITQQEAYNVFGLLCDVGGGLGLFLGASAISLCELVDLFLVSAFGAVYRERSSCAKKHRVETDRTPDEEPHLDGGRIDIPRRIWLKNEHIFDMPVY